MSDKTEQPTPRRLRKARADGDVPTSAALTSGAALLAAVLTLPAAARFALQELHGLMHLSLRGVSTPAENLVAFVARTTLPLLGCTAAVALIVGFAQTGGLVSPKRLAPKLDSLNPISGMKRLFRLERWFSVLRALMAATVVAWLAARLLRNHAGSIAHALGQPRSAIALGAELASSLLWQGVAVTVVLAGVDYAFTRREWLKRHRMSKDEVQREHRESEGDPHQKQERKRAHQELLDQATLLSLKDADVLIVNPTHIAVGLRYNEEHESAPRVVAQGQEYLAKRMIEAARAYGIPVVRDITVARALHELSVGEEIPEELYVAVAEILRSLWEEAEAAGEPPRDAGV